MSFSKNGVSKQNTTSKVIKVDEFMIISLFEIKILAYEYQCKYSVRIHFDFNWVKSIISKTINNYESFMITDFKSIKIRLGPKDSIQRNLFAQIQ